MTRPSNRLDEALLVSRRALPEPIRESFEAQVTRDAAIAQRNDLALAALRRETPASSKGRARAEEAR